MFNKEQLEFINSPLINLKLLGIPGGGKTRCIIEHIHQNILKENLKNSDEYLICTFSRKAKQDFLTKGTSYVGKLRFVDQRNKKNVFNYKNVRTIHSISGLINNDRKCSSMNTTVLSAYYKLVSFSEKDNKNINENTSFLEKFKNIKIIYIDEAQDISEIQNDFLQLLAKVLNSKLCYIGDPNQNIYQFQDGSDKYLLNYKAEKTVHLKINYRSTPQLIHFYNQILPHQSKEFWMTSLKEYDVEYNKPDLFIGTYQEIENDIMLTIQKTKYKYENIAIISPVKLSKFVTDSYLSLGLSLIRHLFIKNNIPFIQHYSDGNIKFDDPKTKMKEGHINLMTVHGSKGLEFDQVIVLNYHITTMSRLPSLKQYNQFKYLWYVAMTRAKYDLKIYIDEKRTPFNSIYNVQPDIYTLNKEITKPEYKNFEEKDNFKCAIGVTEIINKLKPNQEYNFEKLIKFEAEKCEIFDNGKLEPYEFQYYGDCYGNFIETVFEYYFLLKHNKPLNELSLIAKLKNMIENTIFIPNQYNYLFNQFKKSFISIDEGLTLDYIHKYKDNFSKELMTLYYFIKNEINNDFQKRFYLKVKDKLKLDNYEKLQSIIDKLENNIVDENENIKDIWKLCIFMKSENYESGYLNKQNFDNHLNSVQIVIQNIKRYINEINCEKFKFQIYNEHPNLPIIGVIDIMEGHIIIDIKFTKSLSNSQIYQLLLYYNNIFPNWGQFMDLKILNLFQGVIYNIYINDINNYQLNKLLCNTLHTKMVNNIFIYDLETTSLNTNECEIIQRHFEEYNLDFVASSGFIKCYTFLGYNHITGLTNEIVNENGDKLIKFENEINDIFKYCNDPLFIAHNGNSFDHKIMKNNYKLFDQNTNTDDSKIIIRMIYEKEDLLNYSLEKLYKKIINKPIIAHDAGNDVYMVKTILKELNYLNKS
jgi:hypothetical protein